MKLFSATEAVNTSEDKKRQNINQIAFLERTLNDLQKRINTETAEFDKRLKELNEVYGQEKTNLQQNIKSLMEEVIVLENKKKIAMEPVDKLQAEVEKQKRELKKLIEQAQEDKKSGENQLRAIGVRLDSVCSQEKEVEDKQTKLEEINRKIQVKESNLKDRELAYETNLKKFQKDLEERGAELSKKESTFWTKERALTDNLQRYEAEYTKKMEELNLRKEQLESEFKQAFDNGYKVLQGETDKIHDELSKKENSLKIREEALISNIETHNAQKAIDLLKLKDQRDTLNRLHAEITNKNI